MLLFGLEVAGGAVDAEAVAVRFTPLTVERARAVLVERDLQANRR